LIVRDEWVRGSDPLFPTNFLSCIEAVCRVVFLFGLHLLVGIFGTTETQYGSSKYALLCPLPEVQHWGSCRSLVGVTLLPSKTAGLPSISLTVSYRFFCCRGIRSDVAKFYVGQISAKLCNLRRMKGVENRFNKIPLPAPALVYERRRALQEF
jgi:hypothetical protein